MATQISVAVDSTVGANSGTKKIAPGHAPELQPKPGSENKTPAPTTTVSLALGKDTMWGASDGGPHGNPGANRYGGASSIAPGTKAAPATINAQAPTDVVLDNLVKVGSARGSHGDDWQTRDLTDPHDNPKRSRGCASWNAGRTPGRHRACQVRHKPR